jgi:hypothetical protein
VGRGRGENKVFKKQLRSVWSGLKNGKQKSQPAMTQE